MSVSAGGGGEVACVNVDSHRQSMSSSSASLLSPSSSSDGGGCDLVTGTPLEEDGLCNGDTVLAGILTVLLRGNK